MLNTPSVIMNFLLAPRLILRVRSFMSLCLKINNLAPHSLQASIILAWFSLSLNIKSFFSISEDITPRFAIYPVGKISEFPCDLCFDNFFSSILNKLSFPATKRELD